MLAAKKRNSSLGNDQKSRRLTMSGEMFHKLKNKIEDNTDSPSPRDRKRSNGEAEHKYKRIMSTNDRGKYFQARNSMASTGDGSRKMTLTSDKFMQIIQKTGPTGRSSKAMSTSASTTTKPLYLDLLQDINLNDTGCIELICGHERERKEEAISMENVPYQCLVCLDSTRYAGETH
ncbi:unnamed protein product [Rodentolepis nana]|uniref:Zinc finger, RING/FYVE/PHD-type n=1 Tax=Rodentolepis nana TaxID=102285 RepID=A0A0R3TZG2_RODNA|nr:unnamed protein product [Rodentolepis nana]